MPPMEVPPENVYIADVYFARVNTTVVSLGKGYITVVSFRKVCITVVSLRKVYITVVPLRKVYSTVVSLGKVYTTVMSLYEYIFSLLFFVLSSITNRNNVNL